MNAFSRILLVLTASSLATSSLATENNLGVDWVRTQDSGASYRFYELDGGDDGSSTDWFLLSNFSATGSNSNFSIYSQAGVGTGAVLILEAGSPQNTIYAEDTGNLGFGTSTPSAAAHLLRSDGNAKFLVEELNDTKAKRTLFAIQNKGNTVFEVNNTDDTLPDAIDGKVSWGFANPGTGFRLSRQQSGSVEFEVFNDGSAKLLGGLTIGGPLVQPSDRNMKQGIEKLDHGVLLAKVMELPISKWSYKTTPGSRHIGPMAQDFYKSFGLGDTDKGITSIDTGGVALAAIQGLKQEKDADIEKLEAQKNTQIAALNTIVSHQESVILEQEERLLQLEMAVSELIRNASDEAQLSSAN